MKTKICSANLMHNSSIVFRLNLLRNIGDDTSWQTDVNGFFSCINSHYGNKDTPVRGKLPVKQLEAATVHVTDN
jgi:hypothetical protein